MATYIVYSGAASTYLDRLDRFQARVEKMCGFTFQSLKVNCGEYCRGDSIKILGERTTILVNNFYQRVSVNVSIPLGEERYTK